MKAQQTECDGDAMNFAFQYTLQTCAAICHLKNGNAFSYGVQGGETCKGACVCKCWTRCSLTKTSTKFHLYQFLQEYTVKEQIDGKRGMYNLT